MTGILNLLMGVGGALKDTYFNLVSLLLPGNGTNGAQNNTFLDSSTNNFTITRNGNTTQGTFSPFSQTGWGNYFSGGAYLSIGTTTAFSFSTGDFTIEGWIFPTSDNICMFDARAGNTATPWVLNVGTGTSTYFYDGTSYTSSIGITLNQWNHVAVSRSSGTLKIFVNGQQGYSNAYTANLDRTAGIRIGNNVASGQSWTGYLSNIRIVKGQALYTGAFTPSTTPLTTTSQGATAGNVSLLSCQSNRFIDNSTNAFTLTPNGSPSVVAFSPFAPTAAYTTAAVGGSGYFDGTGDELNAGSNAAFGFGTSAYTVELWVYLTAAVSATHAPCFVFNDATGGFGFWNENGGSQLQIATRAGVTVLSAGTTLTANTWNHIVAVRSGTGANQTSIFVNGSRVANGTDATNYTITGPLKIGGISLSNFYVNGYLSNVRIVKGSAVYDPTLTSLTVPTSPPTNITNTSLLLNFTNAGVIDATAKNDLETVGNAQISTAQSKWGGGSMYFDGTGDYLRWTTSNFFNVYQGSNTVEMWIYPTSISSGGSNSSKYGTLFVQQALGSSIQFGLGFNSSGQLVYTYWNGSATVQITSTETLSVNTWSHVGFTYTSSGIALFVNGVYKAPTAITGSPSASATEPMFIGIEGRTAGSEVYYQGYIDDLRVTKGIARYTANFTAPTAPFPLQ